MSEKDTNIVSAEDLSFLKQLGISEETTETPKEETTEEDKSTETVKDTEEKVNVPPVNNGIKDSINLLISTNSWEDIALKYEDSEYENISDLLDKVNVDENLFESLVKLQKELKENKLQNEYISLENRDEVKVKLAKAILEGVDYTDLIQYQEELVDPVSNLDFSDEIVAEEFVRQGLMGIEGIPQKYLDAEIKDLKNSYKLIEKAEEYKNIIKQRYEKEIENRTENIIAERKRLETERKENIKNLRKDLKDNNFSQTFIDKAVQLRYDMNDNGEEHYISLIKSKMKEDKKFQNDLIHLLLDKDDFISKIKAPVKQEATKKVLELVSVIPKSGGKSVGTSSGTGNLSEADANFMDLITKK